MPRPQLWSALPDGLLGFLVQLSHVFAQLELLLLGSALEGDLPLLPPADGFAGI